MAYTQLYYHVVLRTKYSRPAIPEEHERTFYMFVYKYMESHNFKLYRIGGMADHIHLFVGLPADISVAKFVHDLKITTNRFLADHPAEYRGFEGWSRSYCALTYNQAEKDAVVRYIANQKEHHRARSFADELRFLLDENHVEIDERYFLRDKED